MTAIACRRARAEDLGAVNAIFHQAQTEGDADAPPVAADGQMWVATESSEVVGFGATIERGDTAFLAELFVRADRRSRGIGRALLARCFEERGRPRMTLGSSDPRALALYVGLGLEPRWPSFHLVGSPSTGLRPTSCRGGEVREVDPEEIVALDAEVSGRRRPQDLEYWHREGDARFLRFARDGGTIGYAVVWRGSDDWVGNEDAITIGPAGARSARDAGSVVAGAIASALGGGKKIRLVVPGPRPALREVLALGFEIAELDTFLASPGALVFDPPRYLPSGGALL
jgi:GNAT superfamily N-acetyltransferase